MSTTSLVKAAEQTSPAESFQLAVRSVAEKLSGELAPGELTPVFIQLKDWEKAVTDLAKAARERMLGLLKEKGRVATEAGTLRAEVDGWKLEARPTRTGIDPKKLEALIRAKGKDPAGYMTPTVTYAVSELGSKKLQDEGVLSAAELETCRHELVYAVQTPKKESEK